jgi:hypothetical protein
VQAVLNALIGYSIVYIGYSIVVYIGYSVIGYSVLQSEGVQAILSPEHPSRILYILDIGYSVLCWVISAGSDEGVGGVGGGLGGLGGMGGIVGGGG